MHHAITSNRVAAQAPGATPPDPAPLQATGAAHDIPIVDVARRAAECALRERRLGARDSVEILYRRAHSLLRALHRHLALLDARGGTAVLRPVA